MAAKDPAEDRIRAAASPFLRGSQQTVSVNNCSEDLFSPKGFGLKCNEELEYSFAQIFGMWVKVMPVVFGEIKMSFWVRREAS